MRPLHTKVAMAALLLAAAWATGQNPGQKPKPPTGEPKKEAVKPGTIEDLVSQALKSNPDIRVAESKVREAEAQLNKVRQDVISKVIGKKAEIAALKAMLNEAETRLKRAKQLVAATAISTEEVNVAQLTFDKLSAELAKAEAELPYLLGKQPPGLVINEINLFDERIASFDSLVLRGAAFAKVVDVQTVPATQAEKLRKALDTPVEVRQSNLPLHDALGMLRDKMQGINLHISSKKLVEANVEFHLQQPVPIGALLQWLEDQLDCRFVIRDYGIVVTERERIPPGAVLVHDFWKNKVKIETLPK